MKTNLWKKTAAIFALSFGALIAPPAYAECDLCSEAKNGNEEAIKTRLNNRPEVPDAVNPVAVDINSVNKKGRTALWFAAEQGHTGIAAVLLYDEIQPANPNIIANKGSTALMQAATGGFLPIVELLINANASVNISRKNGSETALSLAEENGHSDVVEYLLANGAECPDGKVESETGDSCITLPTCGENEVADGNSCVCVDGFTKYDGVNCVAECEDGYEWENDSCIPTAETCHLQDQILVDGECVSCGETKEREGNSCVCVDGFWGFEDDCIPDCEPYEHQSLTTGKCIDLVELACTTQKLGNFNDETRVCEETVASCNLKNMILPDGTEQCESCGENEELQGNSCVCIAEHARPLNGNDCISIPVCVNGEIYNADTVMCDCNANHERVNGFDGCLEKCGDNEMRDGNSCVCVDGFWGFEDDCIPDCEPYEHQSLTTGKCIDLVELACTTQKLGNFNDETRVCEETVASCNLKNMILPDGTEQCESCGENEMRDGNSCVCVDEHTRYDGVNCIPNCTGDEEYIPDLGICGISDSKRCELDGGNYVNEKFGCYYGDSIVQGASCEAEELANGHASSEFCEGKSWAGFTQDYIASDDDISYAETIFRLIESENTSSFNVAKLLAENEESLTVIDSPQYNNNMLTWVAWNYNNAELGEDVLAYFSQHSAIDINHQAKDGRTALYIGVLTQKPWVVDAMIAAGADVNIPHSSGYTPLDYAIRKRRDWAIEKLLAAGAERNLQ